MGLRPGILMGLRPEIFKKSEVNMRIGMISDTHNLLRPEVKEKLQGVDCILHCGDIGSRMVLDELGKIAPVKAVRGNVDKEWAEGIPGHLELELGGLFIYMIHKKKDLPKDLSSYDIVMTGHSHQYVSTWMEAADGHRTLLLNPGSCGPKRFYQAVTMAMLTIDEDGWNVKRIEIPHAPMEIIPGTDSADVRAIIEIVVSETKKGRTVETIARKHKWNNALVEQIVRLYVTHPGVTADGIMTKMGL